MASSRTRRLVEYESSLSERSVGSAAGDQVRDSAGTDDGGHDAEGADDEGHDSDGMDGEGGGDWDEGAAWAIPATGTRDGDQKGR